MDDTEPFSVQLRLSTAPFTLGSTYGILQEGPKGTAGHGLEICTRRDTRQGKHGASGAVVTEQA